MCDYSLMQHQSRLAVDGEELEVYRFPSGSKGFVSAFRPMLRLCGGTAAVPQPAARVPCVICIPPGARLLLHDIPAELQSRLGISDTEEVTFTQVHFNSGCFRDAIRFDQGSILSLQDLQIGQRVEVINVSMPDEVFLTPPEMMGLAA